MSLLAQYNKLKAQNQKCPREFDIQPDHAGQRLLIIKNFAKKLVQSTLETELANFKDRLTLGDFRRFGKSSKHLVSRPPSKPGSGRFGEVAAMEVIVEKSTPKLHVGKSFSARSKQTFINSLSAKPIVIDTAKLTNEFHENFEVQKNHESKNSKRIFDSTPKYIPSCRIVRIYNDGRENEISTDGMSKTKDITASSPTARFASIGPSGKRKTVGMVLVINPTLNSQKKKITFRLRYRDVAHEVAHSDDSLDNAEPVYANKDCVMHSDGGCSYGITLTTSQTQESQFEHKCSLPGWDGRNPIFIPSNVCWCQILDCEGMALASISLAAFPCTSAKTAVKMLDHYVDQFCQKKTSNLIVQGGIPALNLSALHGNYETVVNLLAANANVNHQASNSRNTALHEAVIGGYLSIISLLLKNGANQAISDEKGNNPLHLACQLNQIAVVALLVTGPGAKKALQGLNNHGLKPIDTCESKYLQQKVESAMRDYMIYTKPRISLLTRS